MVRIGLLVNPDAGLGGRLGLKGSDGQAKYARSMGAEDRAGPRVTDSLNYFSKIFDNEIDEELENQEKFDEFSKYFNEEVNTKILMTTSEKPSGEIFNFLKESSTE